MEHKEKRKMKYKSWKPKKMPFKYKNTRNLFHD